MDPENLQFFSTARYDPELRNVPSLGLDHAAWNFRNSSPFYLLDYHRDRILDAARHWNWERAIAQLEGQQGLDRLSQGLAELVGSETHPLRLRIVIDREGLLGLEKFEFPAVPITGLFPRRLPRPDSTPLADEPPKSSPYTLVLDTEDTSSSQYTHFKTTNRAMYNVARDRAGISPKDRKEVLTVEDGFVVEGSITTPYFWRGNRWVTPPVASVRGGQDGVSRRWALENNLAVEEKVPINTLVDGEECWISNGARGFMFALLRLDSP
ncbi:aminotransferase [Emericellopsis atlantica]|uniref:Aminotransferase n=1 Tax=Emericellopsis atlantica TaxID=2614577 RepID=A0A9P8CLX7_9HYPO|nr:aminotransferase [Emericellopsis atlantica]KAG9252089.1 aminotransferase [Emericellopsis atlantica]